MAGIEFKFKHNFNQLVLDINNFAKELTDFRKPLEEATEAVKEHASNEVFATQGAVIDEAWDNGSPTYHGLIQTGNMRASFNKRIEGKDVGVIGNSDYKFPYHQLGTRRGIPARPMLKWADSNIRLVRLAFQKWINELKGLKK